MQRHWDRAYYGWVSRLTLCAIALTIGFSANTLISGFATAYTPANNNYTPKFDTEEQTNINVYQKASQSVVSIATTINGKPSSGAGIVVDNNGLIITSGHVVGHQKEVITTLPSGIQLQGRVIAIQTSPHDLALIKIPARKELQPLLFANSDKLRVGQKVLAIGNPYGFERTLTLGIISRLDPAKRRIQTDAAINPGSSGGPLLDSQGFVAGINQSIFNPDGDRSNVGIAFAVPANDAKNFIHQAKIRLNKQNNSPAVVDLPRYKTPAIPTANLPTHWLPENAPLFEPVMANK